MSGTNHSIACAIEPRRRCVGWCLAAALAPQAVIAQTVTRGPGELLLGGTGAGVAPLQRVLAVLHPVARFVPNLGSSGGLKALAAGAIDAALSARRLNDAERAAGLVERPLLRTPLVWATHAAVPVARLTLAQLADHYGGKVQQWSDGQPVRLVLRPESDSDTQYVKSLGPELARALAAAAQRPGIKVAMTDDEAATDIERILGALGVTTLGVLLAQQHRVNLVELNGVAPSLHALRSGRWPHRKNIQLVTRGEPAASVSTLLQLLQGKTATDAMAALGCALGAEA